MRDELRPGDIIEFNGAIGVVVPARLPCNIGVRWIAAPRTEKFYYGHKHCDLAFSKTDDRLKVICHADAV